MAEQNFNSGYLSRNKRVIDTLKKEIPKHEGVRTDIYADPKGIPTMGIGVALGRKTKGENGRIEVFPKEEVNRLIGLSGSNKTLSQKEYDAVVAAVIKQKKDDPLDARDINTTLGNIPFSLEKAEVQKQFEALLPQKLAVAEKNAAKAGVDLSTLPHSVRVATADLSYRGGTDLVFGEGMRSTEALKEGNIGAFTAELIYASNKEGFDGNDNRNSAFANDILDSLPPAQRQEALQQLQKHKAVIGQEQVAKAEKRFKNQNIKREKRGQPPLKIPQSAEGAEGATGGGGEATSSSAPATTAATTGTEGGGSVKVRAHSRDGKPVQAHTRSTPN